MHLSDLQLACSRMRLIAPLNNTVPLQQAIAGGVTSVQFRLKTPRLNNNSASLNRCEIFWRTIASRL